MTLFNLYEMAKGLPLTQDATIRLPHDNDYDIIKDERHKYKPGDRAVWKDGVYEKQGNGTWHKMSERDDSGDFATPKSESERRRFVNALSDAKSSQPEGKAWRVDTTHKQIDYKRDKILATRGGSVAAITPEGDIISVCKKRGDTQTGAELMREAVEAGGKKLDSYDGNFDFYVKTGFEPISWCKFDETYAPEGWRKGIDKPEPVIFFKYVGIGNVENTDSETFYRTVKPSISYYVAFAIRDARMER